MKNIPALLIAIFTLTACQNDTEDFISGKLPLVVEGWIEEGKAPVVMVTHAVDLTSETASFDDFVEKWGRVTIYDNDKPYILTGRINNAYTPSLIFTSSRLKGTTGHTYRLTIETEDHYAEASAVMNEAPVIRSATPAKEADGYSLLVRLGDTDGVVQFQTQSLKTDTRFYPAFNSTYTSLDILNNEIKVTKGIHAAFDEEEANAFSHYFSPGETVMLKVCRIPDELYPFWTAYDQAVSLSGNLFLSMPQNCRGNVEGALGYFSASGISAVAVKMPE